jgi:hypothetical protein
MTDLYGDSNAALANGLVNGVGRDAGGPSKFNISAYDVLAGVGKIIDMEFGIATTDQGVGSSTAIGMLVEETDTDLPSAGRYQRREQALDIQCLPSQQATTLLAMTLMI